MTNYLRCAIFVSSLVCLGCRPDIGLDLKSKVQRQTGQYQGLKEGILCQNRVFLLK